MVSALVNVNEPSSEGGAEREQFVRTRNLQEGLLGDADFESEHSGSSSGDDSEGVPP